ncbi:hypothetical protein QL093DRAFT_2641137 [Fusarium oxysporum]|nr:hypothetical protein QL093DRAFT_2641137 [Fusarium oxysporum]
MLVNMFCLIAFATLTVAAPQRPDLNRDPDNNGDRIAQTKRVEDLRNKGLTCHEGAQEAFICSDGLGGDWSVNLREQCRACYMR